MTPAQASELLLETWKATWPTLRPTVDYAFDNESFRGATPSWARVSIVPGRSEQRSMGKVGTRRFERFGTIAVQLFGELDAGRKPLDDLAADVCAIFESKHLTAAGDPLWTKAASVPAQITKDGWFQLTFAIPFSYFALG